VVKNRIVLAAVAGSAALIPLAGVAVLGVGPAGAAATGISCAKVGGNANVPANSSKITLKTCNGNTGTKGTIKGTAAVGSTGTVKWANGKSTSFTESTATGTKCAATGGPIGGALVADEVLSGSVTADTTGSTTVGAAVTAEVCVYPTATTGVYAIKGAPHTPWVFAA
jgi:hypothetical protein